MSLNVQKLVSAGVLQLLLRSNTTGPLEINLLPWVKRLHFPDSLETNLALGRLKFQLVFILLHLLHLLWALFIIKRHALIELSVLLCLCVCVTAFPSLQELRKT